MHPGHILLVEDDDRLASLLTEYLREHGLTVDHATEATEAYRTFAARVPDVVLLDWMLPGEDGLTICRKLRSSFDGSIIMLTARRTDQDQVAGLEQGADDYVVKPVDPRVLLARIRSHLRRQAPDDSPAPAFGRLRVDLHDRSACVEDADVRFTDMEVRVLCLLAQHAPDVVSRELLTKAVRGVEYNGLDRGIDIHISRIRRKLRTAGANAEIRAVRGEGYCLQEVGA